MAEVCSLLLLTLAHMVTCAAALNSKPHIIFVVADDLGWNDVGFHNPALWTPNIDDAAHNGIILNYSYVQQLCTPSRSAFMTGYYPSHNGILAGAVEFFGPSGLPLQFRLLPQALKDLGYSTNMVGKWHLGSCHPKYLPTNRGFDTFFGYLGGGEHYYSHSYPLTESGNASTESDIQQVYDFWNQTNAALEYNGTHSSIPFMSQVETILANRTADVPLFLYMAFQESHSPIEADEDNLLWYSTQANFYRRGDSALITQLDQGFGQLIKMLKDYGIYDQSIVIFTADNGGETRSGGNNYPLRGGKMTVYEGGTRASAFIHSPLLKNTGFCYNGLIHAVDWYPTIVALAGGNPDLTMDGFNVWPSIVNDGPSPRSGFIYDMVDIGNGTLQGALRYGKWKLIFGDGGFGAQIKPENVTGEVYYICGGAYLQDPNSPPFQLYNIDDDPTESNDLADVYPSHVARLYQKVQQYKLTMVKSVYLPNDIDFYKNVTSDLTILNTNWCEAVENGLEIFCTYEDFKPYISRT